MVEDYDWNKEARWKPVEFFRIDGTIYVYQQRYTFYYDKKYGHLEEIDELVPENDFRLVPLAETLDKEEVVEIVSENEPEKLK